MNEQMNKQTNKQTNIQMNKRTNKRTNERTNDRKGDRKGESPTRYIQVKRRLDTHTHQCHGPIDRRTDQADGSFNCQTAK